MNTRDKITEEIISFISNTRNIPRDRISIHSTFLNDLGIDSLEMMELIFDLEERYGLNLICSPAEVLTINDLAEILNKKLVDKSNIVA